MLPTTFRSIWPSCFRVEDFQKSTNQKQELPVVAMFVNGSGQNEQFLQRTFHRCFLPSFGSFGKAVSEEKIFFRNQPIRNKNCLWQPCLLTERDEMSNRITDAPYQVSFHLAKQFQKTRIDCGGHVCQWIGTGTKLALCIKDRPQMLPTKCRFIWPSGFRGEEI